ncbi:DUF1517 domain-containing protein [Leptothermofonsia sp. ETS-13]|uniref:DUF1517 domain-containing protein n=1 Tax=Leptothermofonsia sp. ETS-13 TaxID=3035696 RepID=UPI003BA23A71
MNQELDEIDNFDDSELTNDIVTVSKLQVALRARARTFQSKLEQLTVSADTRSIEGLFELLQKTAYLLLEYSEFWTHVLASSETFASRETAAELFNHLFVHERGKGNTRSQAELNGAELSPVGLGDNHFYVVVTLLLCTADDQPLFEEIYSASLLRDVLQEITMMRESYLMAFELLWIPQGSMESLQDEDLAMIYGDMVAIA